MVMTGVPAFTAASTAAFTPSVFAIDTTRPSGFVAIAHWISWLCFTGSGSDW